MTKGLLILWISYLSEQYVISSNGPTMYTPPSARSSRKLQSLFSDGDKRIEDVVKRHKRERAVSTEAVMKKNKLRNRESPELLGGMDVRSMCSNEWRCVTGRAFEKFPGHTDGAIYHRTLLNESAKVSAHSMPLEFSLLMHSCVCCVILVQIHSHYVKFKVGMNLPNQARDQAEKELVTDARKSTVARLPKPKYGRFLLSWIYRMVTTESQQHWHLVLWNRLQEISGVVQSRRFRSQASNVSALCYRWDLLTHYGIASACAVHVLLAELFRLLQWINPFRDSYTSLMTPWQYHCPYARKPSGIGALNYILATKPAHSEPPSFECAVIRHEVHTDTTL